MDIRNEETTPQKINKKNKQFWTKKQDSLLIAFVENNKLNINWKEIAENFSNMTHKQCYYRYRNLNPLLKRGHWSEEEEQKLKELFGLYGGKWALISKKMGGKRSGKQIRHHYKNISDKIIKIFNGGRCKNSKTL